jgi:hypothetical protein
MPHRQVQPLYATGEDARRIRVNHQMNPTIFESALIIARKAQIPPGVVTIDGWQHTEFRQKLKSVADPQHKAACAHKPYQPVDQSLRYSGILMRLAQAWPRKVVAVQESAGKQLSDTQPDRPRPVPKDSNAQGQLCRIRPVQSAGFMLAVDAVTGRDQSLNFHIFPEMRIACRATNYLLDGLALRKAA